MVIGNGSSSSYTELDRSDWVDEVWWRVVIGLIYSANGSDDCPRLAKRAVMARDARLEDMVERAIGRAPRVDVRSDT